MCVLMLCCSQVRGVQPLFIPTRTLNPVKDEVPYSRSNFKVTSFFIFFFFFASHVEVRATLNPRIQFHFSGLSRGSAPVLMRNKALQFPRTLFNKVNAFQFRETNLLHYTGK